MAHKTLISGTAYEVKGGKCLVNGTSYDIKKGRTLINGTGEDIVFSSVSPILDEKDWTTIREVSDAGQGANYWSIGDRKAVTLNGTGLPDSFRHRIAPGVMVFRGMPNEMACSVPSISVFPCFLA